MKIQLLVKNQIVGILKEKEQSKPDSNSICEYSISQESQGSIARPIMPSTEILEHTFDKQRTQQ
jgi:hypothetical protein